MTCTSGVYLIIAKENTPEEYIYHEECDSIKIGMGDDLFYRVTQYSCCILLSYCICPDAHELEKLLKHTFTNSLKINKMENEWFIMNPEYAKNIFIKTCNNYMQLKYGNDGKLMDVDCETHAIANKFTLNEKRIIWQWLPSRVYYCNDNEIRFFNHKKKVIDGNKTGMQVVTLMAEFYNSNNIEKIRCNKLLYHECVDKIRQFIKENPTVRRNESLNLAISLV